MLQSLDYIPRALPNISSYIAGLGFEYVLVVQYIIKMSPFNYDKDAGG